MQEQLLVYLLQTLNKFGAVSASLNHQDLNRASILGQPPRVWYLIARICAIGQLTINRNL